MVARPEPPRGTVEERLAALEAESASFQRLTAAIHAEREKAATLLRSEREKAADLARETLDYRLAGLNGLERRFEDRLSKLETGVAEQRSTRAAVWAAVGILAPLFVVILGLVVAHAIGGG